VRIDKCPFCDSQQNLIYWKNFDSVVGCEVCKFEHMKKNGITPQQATDWIEVVTKHAQGIAEQIKKRNEK